MGQRTEAELRLELANLKMLCDKQTSQLERIDKICDENNIPARSEEKDGIPSGKIVTDYRVQLLSEKLYDINDQLLSNHSL